MGKGHFSFARLFLVAFLVFIAACQASAEQRRPARRGGGSPHAAAGTPIFAGVLPYWC